MKKSIFVLTLLFSTPIFSHNYISVYKSGNICYGIEYKEKYIPGNSKENGYVMKWEESKKISCKKHGLEKNNNILEINKYTKIIQDKFKDLKLFFNKKIEDFKENKE